MGITRSRAARGIAAGLLAMSAVAGVVARQVSAEPVDVDPPSQPGSPRWTDTSTGLLTVSIAAEDGRARASWTASTDAASAIASYLVQVDGDADFATPILEQSVDGATRSLILGPGDGLQYGGAYYFRVRAIDAAGNQSTWSAPSNRLLVTDQTTGPAIVHAPVPTAYVGQDIPISTTTSCDGPEQTCSARVFWRSTPMTGLQAAVDGVSDLGWQVVELSRGATTTIDASRTAIGWSTTLPDSAVTTSGVDYYLEAIDTEARSTFPGGVFVGSRLATGVQPAAHAFHHVQVVNPPVLTHVTPLYARDGAEVPIELQATCSTGSCEATLYFRTSEGTVFDEDLVATPPWPRVAMSRFAPPLDLGGGSQVLSFAATIPAEVVDTNGVDYFMHVTDGATQAWWPGTTYQGYYAPTDGMRTAWHHLHTIEPPHAVHEPTVAAPYRQSVPVEAQSTCTSGECTARLYFRTTTTPVLTEASFDSADMTVTSVGTVEGVEVVGMSGAIPAAYADTRGVDYFFSVSDGATTTWWPGTALVDGYVPVEGERVAYHHIRIVDPPHFAHVPLVATPALEDTVVETDLTCVVDECSVTLSYTSNPTALEPPFETVAMVRVGDPIATPTGYLARWRGVIPGADVVTTGLGYFLSASDGHVTSYQPGTSYSGAYVPVGGVRMGVHVVRVVEPPHLFHAPVATSYYDQPIAIEATANCATGTCTGRLHWRTSGHDWLDAPMTIGPGGPATPAGDTLRLTATIPAGDVTTEGVDYWLGVDDGYATDRSATYHTTVLTPTAILHAPVLTAQPGVAIAVEAAVPCATLSCAADVFWRVPGDALLAEPAWQRIAMPGTGAPVPVGAATSVRIHRAVIPAEHVTTRGIEYYLRAQDGHTTAFSPGSAYIATQATRVDGQRVHYFSVHVIEPVHVAHVPALVAQTGDPIPIEATATCASDVCTATLGYRTTPTLGSVNQILGYAAGGPPFSEVAMAATEVAGSPGGRVVDLAAVIPASTVTAAGVDYWIRVNDGGTSAYLPGTSYVSPAGSADGTRAAWWHTAITATRTTGTIGDLVWVDRDGDASRDVFEPVLPGARLILTVPGLDGLHGTPDDQRLKSTRTDAAGAYVFTGLASGGYRVTVDAASLPSGITTSAPSHQDVVIIAADARLDVDFAYRYPEAGGIDVVVWHDIDADNSLDGGEQPIVGTAATLTWPGYDGVAATGDERTWGPITTGADGVARFTDLPDGTFTITLDTATVPHGTALVSGSNPTVVELAPLATTTVRTGYRYTGHIDVTVWDDTDTDDVIDPGEQRISDATVVIHHPGPDGLLRTSDDVVEATKPTGGDGKALFPYLAPGLRRVVVAGRLDIDWEVTP